MSSASLVLFLQVLPSRNKRRPSTLLAPKHFMVEFWKPHLVPSGLAEQEQASSEFFPKRPSECSPEPLAIWNKELEGLVLNLL